MSATPVFVLGLQRSGTTWLATLLGGHPDVACVEAEDHFGIHESIFFSHFARAYGDLADDACFARFARDFIDSDYYILTELEASFLWQRRPRGYAEAFRAVMDEVARRRGASLWVEKSPHHTLLADDLARLFPDSRFIGVVRGVQGQVRSRVYAPGRDPGSYPGRASPILAGCAASALYRRFLRGFDARHGSSGRTLMVAFEDLVADKAAVMRRVADFLGAAYLPVLTEERFGRNSSFDSAAEKRRAFSAADRALVALGHGLASLTPLSVLAGLERRRRRARGIEWPDWCWRRRPRSPAEGRGAN